MIHLPVAPAADEFSTGGGWYGYRWRASEGAWRHAKPKVLYAGPVTSILVHAGSVLNLPLQYRSFQLRVDSLKYASATLHYPMLHLAGSNTMGGHTWTANYSDHTIPATTTMAAYMSDPGYPRSSGLPLSIYAHNHAYNTANAICDIDPGSSTIPNSTVIQSGGYAQGYMVFALIGGQLNASYRIGQLKIFFQSTGGVAGETNLPTSGYITLIGYE